jgi:hypothetical protein
MSAIDELLDQDNWHWSNDVNSVAVFDGDKDAYLPKASEELASLKSELERMRAVVDAAKEYYSVWGGSNPSAEQMRNLLRAVEKLEATK